MIKSHRTVLSIGHITRKPFHIGLGCRWHYRMQQLLHTQIASIWNRWKLAVQETQSIPADAWLSPSHCWRLIVIWHTFALGPFLFDFCHFLFELGYWNFHFWQVKFRFFEEFLNLSHIRFDKFAFCKKQVLANLSIYVFEWLCVVVDPSRVISYLLSK